MRARQLPHVSPAKASPSLSKQAQAIAKSRLRSGRRLAGLATSIRAATQHHDVAVTRNSLPVAQTRFCGLRRRGLEPRLPPRTARQTPRVNDLLPSSQPCVARISNLHPFRTRSPRRCQPKRWIAGLEAIARGKCELGCELPARWRGPELGC